MALDDALARIAQLEQGAADRQAELDAKDADRSVLVATLAVKDAELAETKAVNDALTKRVAELQQYDAQFQEDRKKAQVAEALARGKAIIDELAALGVKVDANVIP